MASTQPQHRFGRLRKDALNVIGAVVLSMAFMGPCQPIPTTWYPTLCLYG